MSYKQRAIQQLRQACKLAKEREYTAVWDFRADDAQLAEIFQIEFISDIARLQA